MDRILLVGCGGFIGAVLRYLVSLGTQRLLGTPLYGTLVVNVVGCLLIGFLGGLAEERQYLTSQLRLFLFVGLLGGFTTFSSVAYETAQILRAGQVPAALVHIGLQLLLGIPAVFVGYWAAR